MWSPMIISFFLSFFFASNLTLINSFGVWNQGQNRAPFFSPWSHSRQRDGTSKLHSPSFTSAIKSRDNRENSTWSSSFFSPDMRVLGRPRTSSFSAASSCSNEQSNMLQDWTLLCGVKVSHLNPYLIFMWIKWAY